MVPARYWLATLAIVLAGGYALVGVQQRIDRIRAEFGRDEQFLYLSHPVWVKRLSLGYDGLLACIYWTRAVQHYGRQRLGTQQYGILYPLLDITTTLDPRLLLAYRFGAIFLSEEPPKGPGQYEKAVELLEKGIRHNPDYWRFWYDLGFLHYRKQHYEGAARAWRRGAQHPGSPPWMNALAARAAAEAGQRDFARFLWSQLYRLTDNPAIRQNALEHLEGLKADEDLENLHSVVEQFRQKTGRRPRSFQEVVAAGLLPGRPRDPRGYPYVIDRDGKVRLHPDSPVEHSRLGRPQDEKN